jgi:hypothetical protein
MFCYTVTLRLTILRWEPYDPTKSYEKYTIADAKLNFNKKAPAPVVPKVSFQHSCGQIINIL